MADYFPRSDSQLALWASSFSNNVAAAPADLGFTPADAAAIADAVEAYVAAHAATQARQTRTQLDVLGKNQARKTMIALLRRHVRLLRANSSLPPERLADLGLPALRAARAGVPGPATRPILQVLTDAPLRHRVRYSDAAAIDRRDGAGARAGAGAGKPAGVVGLQLFCHVGENPPADPLDARFVRLVTRQGQAVDFKPAQMGQSAFYYGRWQTATGDTGPWSQVARMTVAG